ncbi:hypothetical protein Tco_1363405 [Tanacetum coccineum]
MINQKNNSNKSEWHVQEKARKSTRRKNGFLPSVPWDLYGISSAYFEGRTVQLIGSSFMLYKKELSRIHWRHKDKVGIQIPDWMITEEMKHTEHYRMYAEVFGLDVPLTQSQPTESTQRTHRTLSAPRRSTRLTPPAPVPNVDKADEMILQYTLQS